MLRRVRGYLLPRTEPVSTASQELQDQGFAMLRSAFTAAEIVALTEDIDQVYIDHPADARAASVRDPAEDEDFRYAMFNRSALVQQAIAHELILRTIEPLLGEDCHVIANTSWRNPVRQSNTHGGGLWHIDAGPHVPRPHDVAWDERIPYPIFVIGAHIYLQDCPLACGPTGFIPGSHKSGRPPPAEHLNDIDLEYDGHKVVPVVAQAGDICLFVSDVWHRRLPAEAAGKGRYFLQVHYGRRDIAQRILPTSEVNHVTEAAQARITCKRESQLLGLHDSLFYDG